MSAERFQQSTTSLSTNPLDVGAEDPCADEARTDEQARSTSAVTPGSKVVTGQLDRIGRADGGAGTDSTATSAENGMSEGAGFVNTALLEEEHDQG